MKKLRVYLKLFTSFIDSSKSCYIIYNNNDNRFIVNYSNITKRIDLYCNIINVDFNLASLSKHKKCYKLKAHCCEEDNAYYIYNLFLISKLWNLKLVKNIN